MEKEWGDRPYLYMIFFVGNLVWCCQYSVIPTYMRHPVYEWGSKKYYSLNKLIYLPNRFDGELSALASSNSATHVTIVIKIVSTVSSVLKKKIKILKRSV